jgi:hypothetical protein
MARVTYGALVTELAGSIGGLTFHKNASGNIARLKPYTPVNPSTLQAAQQNRLNPFIRAWQILSAANKTSWNNFAIAHPHINEFGESKTLNGFQWFMSCNLNRKLVGEGAISAAPGWTAMAAPTSFTLSKDATHLTLTFTAPYDPAPYYLRAYVTSPIRQSTMKLRRSTFRFPAIGIAGGTTMEFKAAYEAAFNVTWSTFYNTAACSIIIRLKTIQSGTGLASSYTSALIKLP